MKPGMFWLTVPRPETTHEPSDGLASWSEPVCMNFDAGSCAGTSVHIERTTHMSSTHSPSIGNTSLTSTPDCPHFLKSNGDGNARPVRPGSVLSSKRSSVGLGSNVSTCDGAPPAKMWITRLALPAKWGWRGDSADAG